MLNIRSNSLLKRFKTEKTQRNYIIGWKAPNKTPTSRNQLSNRSPLHCQNSQKIQLKQKDSYIINCVNHPSKKATFQSKESLKQAFCQECSIKMAKNNMRMFKLSQESLYLRSTFEAEMQRLFIYQEQVRQLMSRFFEAQRQSIRISFLKVRQSSQKIIKLPYYKVEALNESEFTTKIQQLFGSINFKKHKTIHNHQRRFTNEIDLQNLHDPNSNSQKQNIDTSNICPNTHSKSSIEGKLKRMGYRQAQKIICHR